MSLKLTLALPEGASAPTAPPGYAYGRPSVFRAAEAYISMAGRRRLLVMFTIERSRTKSKKTQ